MSEERPPNQPLWRSPLVLVVAVAIAVCVSIPLIGGVSILMHWSAKEQSPAEDIARLLKEELGLVLPAGTTIAHSDRMPAGMDSGGAYELRLPTDAAPAFVEQIKAAAESRQWQVTETSSSPLLVPHPPPWWNPEAAGVTTWLELGRPERDAYRIGVSPTTGQCLIHRMTF